MFGSTKQIKKRFSLQSKHKLCTWFKIKYTFSRLYNHVFLCSSNSINSVIGRYVAFISLHLSTNLCIHYIPTVGMLNMWEKINRYHLNRSQNLISIFFMLIIIKSILLSVIGANNRHRWAICTYSIILAVWQQVYLMQISCRIMSLK